MTSQAELTLLSQTPEGQEQIRVMVALLDGWRMIPGEKVSSLGHLFALNPNGGAGFVPPYTTSLDAVRPMEMNLTQDQSYYYVDYISPRGCRPFDAITASPMDRCIALILTLQKP